MPIRFRCVYCNQLLGISRRKAGNVVRCTNCGGQIIVPDAEPEPEVLAIAGTERRATRKETLPDRPSLLENSDFEAMLKPVALNQRKLVDDVTVNRPTAQEFNLNALQRVTSANPSQVANRVFLIGVGLTMLVIGLIVGYLIGRP